jgi:hypothetical protein
MDILHAGCAGLDVHRDFVTVCVLLPGEDSEPSKHMEQYGTTTQELRRLSQWLEREQVMHRGDGIDRGVLETRCSTCWRAVANWCWSTAGR